MKKSLIALAVLAASGAAMAQSSVQVYGIADVYLGKSTTKNTLDGDNTKTSTTGLESGGWDTSRIGFKGTEDLGGGLKANFQIETAIALDAPGSTTLGGRTAYVGLAGGFGEVQLGKNWTAYDDVWGIANNNFDSVFTARPMAFGYTDNPNNTIKYISPSFGGFSGAVSYSLGEDKQDGINKAGSVVALNVTYANGPLTVAFAHQAEKLGRIDGTNPLGLEGIFVDTEVTPVEFNPEGFATGTKLTNNQVAASYDFGVAKLQGLYNQSKLSLGANSVKSNEYAFGVEVPVAANLSVAAGYGQAKVKVAGVEQGKTKAYGFAVNYTLSKRTNVYAGYSQEKSTVVGLAGSVKESGYAVGVKHSF